VAEGHQATTPMQAEKIKITSVPWSTRAKFTVHLTSSNPVYHRWRTAYWCHNQSLPLIQFNSIDAKALNAAQTKWNSNIFEALTAFQGGVFLGELRQTLDLVVKPGRLLRRDLWDLYKSLKKTIKGMSRRDALRAVAERWLEFVYGVRPLLSDIEAATQYLADHQDRLARELVRVSGGSGEMWDTPTRSLNSEGTYSVGITRWDLYTKRGASARYSGAIVSQAGSTTTKVLDHLGFSPRNFAPTVYNLIPWSFVIDYFSNMGSIVEAWSNQTLSLAWGSLTTKQLVEQQASSVVFQTPEQLGYKSFYHETDPGFYHCQRKRVFRSKVDSLPVPSISFKIPGYSTKWINLAALLIARDSLKIH